jgi:bifunctional non-homologous end joining protein LigD
VKRRLSPEAIEPMYATVGTEVPSGAGWTFEPKYDGMRVLAFVNGVRVRLMTRNGRDKAAQFPELTSALGALGRKFERNLVLDGEVVALERNRPGHFQALQGRFHLKGVDDIATASRSAPAVLMAFDILAEGAENLLDEPWTNRRARLERLMRNAPDAIRLSESSPNGARMIARARKGGWEGVIAKRAAANYSPGSRSRDWLKLKLQHRAEFVIGGFTDPRRTRPYLGAILLGYFDSDGRLCYVGHTGGGFNRTSLRDMLERLSPLEQKQSPFVETPRTNERAHWVKPRVVVEVKFAEWTADGRLRQPIFLGVRDDKNARDVHRERESLQYLTEMTSSDRKTTSEARTGTVRRAKRQAKAAAKRGAKEGTATKRGPAKKRVTQKRAAVAEHDVAAQLSRLESAETDGVIKLAGARTLHVSSLDKVFFEEAGITKGDVMRYYATVAPLLLPLIKDRPLILKRYPNGIGGPSFFQQNAGKYPPSVRAAEVATEDGERAIRLVGGDLVTLLYTVQLGTIAVHPWQSRLPTIEYPDYSTIDLDPGEGVPFTKIVELAKLIEAELDATGLKAALKTSGSRGLHIVLPLPPKTPYARSAALAEAIAARVTAGNPYLATLERSLHGRPKGTIYVDAKQNARGKSVASAYSVRERPGAPVSAPLRWSELDGKLRIGDFTIATMPRRLGAVGDLWGEAMKQRNTNRAIDRALAAE